MVETGRITKPISDFFRSSCSTQKELRTRPSTSDVESVVDLVESEEEDIVDLSNDNDQEAGLPLQSDELSGNLSEVMDDSSTAESLQQELLNNVNLGAMYETLSFPSALRPLFENCKGFLERKFGVGIDIHPTNNNNNLQYQLLLTNADPTLIAVAKLELQQIIEHPQTLEDELQTLQRQKIHIFVDESNILLGAKKNLISPEQSSSDNNNNNNKHRHASIQLLPTPLLHLLSNQRTVVEKVVFGSHKRHTPEPALWRQWRDLGCTLHTQTRDTKESFLDDALVGMILSTLSKFSFPTTSTSTATSTTTSTTTTSENSNRRTLVLLTGDGNDNHQRASFVEAVQLALRQGWQVELWCWRACVSRHYLNMQREYACSGRLSVQYLDDYRALVTATAGLCGRSDSGGEEGTRTDGHRKRPRNHYNHNHNHNHNVGHRHQNNHHNNRNSQSHNIITNINNSNINRNATSQQSTGNNNHDNNNNNNNNNRNDRRGRSRKRKRQRCV